MNWLPTVIWCLIAAPFVLLAVGLFAWDMGGESGPTTWGSLIEVMMMGAVVCTAVVFVLAPALLFMRYLGWSYGWAFFVGIPVGLFIIAAPIIIGAERRASAESQKRTEERGEEQEGETVS